MYTQLLGQLRKLWYDIIERTGPYQAKVSELTRRIQSEQKANNETKSELKQAIQNHATQVKRLNLAIDHQTTRIHSLELDLTAERSHVDTLQKRIDEELDAEKVNIREGYATRIQELEEYIKALQAAYESDMGEIMLRKSIEIQGSRRAKRIVRSAVRAVKDYKEAMEKMEGERDEALALARTPAESIIMYAAQMLDTETEELSLNPVPHLLATPKGKILYINQQFLKRVNLTSVPEDIEQIFNAAEPYLSNPMRALFGLQEDSTQKIEGERKTILGVRVFTYHSKEVIAKGLFVMSPGITRKSKSLFRIISERLQTTVDEFNYSTPHKVEGNS